MKIFRYEVPVDDRVHGHRLSGPVLHVECRQLHVIEFWAKTGVQAPYMGYFRAYGTGHDIPDGGVTYHGTVLDGDILVWHLFSGIRHELERGAVR